MNVISKWLFKRRLRQCFQRWNSFGHDMVLETIVDTMENTYTESNWSTRMGVLIEWLLANDKNFQSIAKNAEGEGFLNVSKAVFSDSVEKSYRRARN